MQKLLAGALALLLFGTATCRAQAERSDRDIEAECDKAFPDLVGDFFKRRSCESEAKEKRAAIVKERLEKEQKEAREERARSCISNEIGRLEGVLDSIRSQVQSKTNLTEIAAVLEAATARKTSIAPSDTNIKEKVLVGSLAPKCDTAFYFLINVVATESGKPRYLRVWTENPPKGYGQKDRAIDAFTLDWEKERAAEALADLQAKANLASAAALRKLQLLNLEAKCSGFYGSATTCGQVRFSVGVVNQSDTPIQTISFGWNFLADTNSECPEHLVSKKTEGSSYSVGNPAILIGPGETRWFSIDSERLPDIFRTLPKWCFKITDVTSPIR